MFVHAELINMIEML